MNTEKITADEAVEALAAGRQVEAFQAGAWHRVERVTVEGHTCAVGYTGGGSSVAPVHFFSFRRVIRPNAYPANHLAALLGETVTEGHAQACRELGHATHLGVDGQDTGVCPRCGEVTRTAQKSDVVDQIIAFENGELITVIKKA